MSEYNTKVRNRSAFTIIEVILTLAVSGLVIIGVISSVKGTIDHQRYNDSVYSFRDFLREQYNSLTNVDISLRSSSEHNYCGSREQRGRTDCLLLGKLLKFENRRDGAEVYSVVRMWDVVGRDIKTANNDDDYFRTPELSLRAVGSLDTLDASQVTSDKEYELDWRALLSYKRSEEINDPPRTLDDASFFMFIARSNLTGSIRTYASDNVSTLNGLDGVLRSLVGIGNTAWRNNLNYQPIFCLSLDSTSPFLTKRAVVVRPNGYNASAVEIAPLDNDVDGVRAVQCK